MNSSFKYAPAGEGETYALVGDLYTFKICGKDTGGAYALMEAVVPPGGGPPAHVHSREDESFYVLDGEIEFQVEQDALLAGAGAFVHAPKGIPHRFKNVGTKPAKMLIQMIPAGLEHFIAEAGYRLENSARAPDSVSPAAIEKLMSITPKYGIAILPAS